MQGKFVNPLKLHLGEYSGENWLVANFGFDENLEKQVRVTTDQVRCSEVDDTTPVDYANLLVASKDIIEILQEAVELKPKLVFGEKNEVLELIKRAKIVLDNIVEVEVD